MIYEQRRMLANTFTLSLGPHGADVSDIVSAVSDGGCSQLARGYELTMDDNQVTVLCAFPMMITLDMPQQAANSGFLRHNARYGCRQCFCPTTEKYDLGFGVLELIKGQEFPVGYPSYEPDRKRRMRHYVFHGQFQLKEMATVKKEEYQTYQVVYQKTQRTRSPTRMKSMGRRNNSRRQSNGQDQEARDKFKASKKHCCAICDVAHYSAWGLYESSQPHTGFADKFGSSLQMAKCEAEWQYKQLGGPKIGTSAMLSVRVPRVDEELRICLLTWRLILAFVSKNRETEIVITALAAKQKVDKLSLQISRQPRSTSASMVHPPVVQGPERPVFVPPTEKGVPVLVESGRVAPPAAHLVARVLDYTSIPVATRGKLEPLSSIKAIYVNLATQVKLYLDVVAKNTGKANARITLLKFYNKIPLHKDFKEISISNCIDVPRSLYLTTRFAEDVSRRKYVTGSSRATRATSSSGTILGLLH
ncbi:MAG: hypothetical protein LQ350_000850 [Teloschistes chrysophthalmus]|nr:MAG: hypothetical protein LQ350_000850 [Niorma chrysophthalma]